MSALASPAACYHCGLPAAAGDDWEVVIDGALRPMCCPGCAAVAQAIVDNGFSDYYRTRSAFAAPADEGALVPPQLALVDAAPAPCAGEAGEIVLSVDGIRCAACVWLIERRLARLPGVLEATMNVANARLRVRWDGARCGVGDMLRALHAIGYAAYPYDPERQEARQERERKTLFLQLFMAGLSMMQVMMYALPAYLAGDGAMDPGIGALMRWGALLLSAPAVLYSALPFYRAAWRGVRARMPGMDLPVALGIVAASSASVVATVRGSGAVYFDSVTMFIFLLLASRYVELVARRKAARGLERLRHALPAAATRLPDYPATRAVELVAAATLRAGDVIAVAPGAAIAADGVIVEGATEIDLALLTGESRAQARAAGAAVEGGAVNVAQPILVRVSRGAAESTLAQLVRLAERAGATRPRIALWADRVAAWFVVALLVLTVLVFGAWQLADPARAWEVAIAVLVVSCPCALSLATPSALAAATDSLVRRGVLVLQPHALETLQRATHVVFDKTGTLTQGKPVLVRVQPLAELDRERCLALAAALEAGSAHPLAHAIRAASAGTGGPTNTAGAAQALDLRHEAGQGVQGSIDGVVYRLGRSSFACAAHHTAQADPELTSVYLGDGTCALARLDLADAVRPDAAQVVRAFQAHGKQVIILSGDGAEVVRRVGDQLGITSAVGAQLPEQKLAFVRVLQARGAVVAMVGDGINDAAVLRAADVSFAMGGGAALAQLNADCVLVSGRLASLADCAATAARTLAVIRQNLGWATVYNVVAIPAAAFGFLSPWVSAAGMSVSSALVVLNALRLRRAAPPTQAWA